jgi:hypothetical protein
MRGETWCFPWLQISGKKSRNVGEENMQLELTFKPKELDEVLLNMNLDLAPGPNGLHVLFFE